MCKCVCFLTFDHDHVDIYGADGRLGQALPFLQDVGDFSRGDAVVRLAPECHQLPDGHTLGKKKEKEQDGELEMRKWEQEMMQIRGRGCK